MREYRCPLCNGLMFRYKEDRVPELIAAGIELMCRKADCRYRHTVTHVDKRSRVLV